jgi:hypothetical protein
VLLYQVGVDPGAVWEQQTTRLRLMGDLAQFEARGSLVSAIVGQFAPVRLAFAWTRATNVPVLLGQVNFFMEFDICFYRSQLAFRGVWNLDSCPLPWPERWLDWEQVRMVR